MTDIQILPIFNQAAPGVWADFARICAETMRVNYNYIMDADEIQACIDSDKMHWRRGTNFAFGAYAGDEMVGFIQGRARGRCATIESLYVLPDYQKKKVGHNLLHTAECALPVFANRVDLISLSHAEMFYKHHGYITHYGMNTYEKSGLAAPRCACLPIFKCSRGLAIRMRRVDASFEADLVNKQHLPVFAYFNVDSKITGVAIGDRMIIDARHGAADLVACNLRYEIGCVR